MNMHKGTRISFDPTVSGQRRPMGYPARAALVREDVRLGLASEIGDAETDVPDVLIEARERARASP
jgi:hypothetical protein